MAIWFIACLLWWLVGWRSAAGVIAVAFAVQFVLCVARIGRARILTKRLIEINRLRDTEIGDMVDAQYRKEIGKACL